MAESDDLKSFLIKGRTKAGAVFRPGDWAERLCSAMSSFGQTGRQRLPYSPLVTPVLHEEVKGVKVDGRLHTVEPLAYQFLVSFARDNDLDLVELAE